MRTSNSQKAPGWTFVTATTITIPLAPAAHVGDSYVGEYCFDNLTLRRGGFLVLGDKVTVLDHLSLTEQSVLTHYDARLDYSSMIDLTVGTLEILAGSGSSVDGRGYLGGLKSGNGCTAQASPGITGSTESSGGSYGGLGATVGGTPNAVYGIASDPNELGAGGACRQGWAGGDGGGRVKIVVGVGTIDGYISAVGENASGNYTGSGFGAKRPNNELGFCRTTRSAFVSSYHPHFGKEAPLVGGHGSISTLRPGPGDSRALAKNYRRGI